MQNPTQGPSQTIFSLISSRIGLQARMIASLVLLLSFLLMFMTAREINRERNSVFNQMRKDGIALARGYALGVENSLLLHNAGLSRLTGEAGLTQGIEFLQIVDTSGTVIGHTDIRVVGKKFADPLYENALHTSINAMEKGKTPATRMVKNDRGQDVFCVIMPLVTLGTVAGVLEIGLETSGIRGAVEETNRQSTQVALVVMILGVAAIWLFARSLVKPIRHLAEAAGKIASGDLDQSIVVKSKDEIGQLASSFRYMTRKLRENMNSLRAANEELKRFRHEEKMSLMGRLAAGIAHEVRNPLGAMKTCAQFLAKTTNPEDRSYHFIQLIIREAKRMEGLVSRLLTYARPDESDVSYGDVNTVVDNAIELASLKANQLHVKITRESGVDLPKVFLDEKRLSQALLNLLLNSLDFIDDAGKISVRTSFDGENDSVVITISDTGKGIPKEHQEKIFDPFFTTRTGGTGLGLAIVQQIIFEHNGTIRVESSVGTGTTFIITLPVHPHPRKTNYPPEVLV
jgi:signal transduction histidine kinase